ncbi:MAG: hypothetical protein JSR67_15695 [Proteobacteria bacterium]|nr:hypothetical protein [Pseudomonadota bacterium]
MPDIAPAQFSPAVRAARRTFLLTLACALLAVGAWRPAQAQMPTTLGWTALPASTSLQGSGACPPNYFGGDPFAFASNCQNVIRAWNGAVADTQGNRLIIWGGGHNNYYGNEIYALNLGANPITLTRLKDPTIPTNYANSANCVESLPPGSTGFAPNSREVYEGMAYIANAGVLYMLNGALACGQANGGSGTWTIPLNNISNSTAWTYENPTMIGTQPGQNYNGYPQGNIAVYDPVTGLVFVSDTYDLATYNYKTNTYNRITGSWGFLTSYYMSGAIDPARRLFVAVGGCSAGSCQAGHGVYVADISNPASTTGQNWTAATLTDPNCAQFLSGGANNIGSANPGFVYDPVAGNFVGWPNEGNSVYIITPDTVNKKLSCQVVTFPGGPPNSAHAYGSTSSSFGTFGRFQYFPAYDAFVLVNDWNIPAYVLRLRGNAAPPPSFTLATCPGNTASAVVNIAATGNVGSVSLSASGLPAGATWQFYPASVFDSGSSTLTVTVPSGTPRTTSNVTITGTSGSLTQTSTATMVLGCP